MQVLLMALLGVLGGAHSVGRAPGTNDQPGSGGASERVAQVLERARSLERLEWQLQSARGEGRASLVRQILADADALGGESRVHRENLLGLAARYAEREQAVAIQRGLFESTLSDERRAYAAVAVGRLSARAPETARAWHERALEIIRTRGMHGRVRALFEEAVLGAAEAALHAGDAGAAVAIRAVLYEGPEASPTSGQAAYAMIENGRAALAGGRRAEGRRLFDRMLALNPTWGLEDGARVGLLLERARGGGSNRQSHPEHVDEVRAIWDDASLRGTPESLHAGMALLSALGGGPTADRDGVIVAMVERLAGRRDSWDAITGVRAESYRRLHREVLARCALVLSDRGNESLKMAACDEFLARFGDDPLTDAVRSRRAEMQARLLAR